jgi:7,8-dihydropterin-6-yl-methyl-4-(beta-D-ribofuranosyl)aminobenzene 5'-phosphate synthase
VEVQEWIAITLTLVFDNNRPTEAVTPTLETAWGFACLVERGDTTLLFDTGGDGALLLRNLRQLDKDPTAIGWVILSHEHGDHTGGLRALLDAGAAPRVVVHDAFSAAFRRKVAARTEVTVISAPEVLLPGMLTTGPVAGRPSEQALALVTEEGWIVLTGCAHPGVVKMTRAAREVAGGARSIALVMGGTHLRSAGSQQLATVDAGLRALGVRAIAPTHCTGDRVRAHFVDTWGDACHLVGVGSTFTFRSER